MRKTMIALCALAISACGGENNGTNNNGETNGATNGATNGETNGATNGETNGGTNGETNGSSGGSVATVNWEVTVGEHTTTITDCAYDSATTTGISMMQGPNGVWQGGIGCKAIGVDTPSDTFVVSILAFDSAVGTTDAADFELGCGADGCDGTVNVSITYQDGAAGILNTAKSQLVMDRTGSFTLDTFDTETGKFSGSLDVTMMSDGVEYSLSGTFDATLYDCTDQPNCNGSGM